MKRDECIKALEELLAEVELETSKGETFILRYALLEDCCIKQLAEVIYNAIHLDLPEEKTKTIEDAWGGRKLWKKPPKQRVYESEILKKQKFIKVKDLDNGWILVIKHGDRLPCIPAVMREEP